MVLASPKKVQRLAEDISSSVETTIIVEVEGQLIQGLLGTSCTLQKVGTGVGTWLYWPFEMLSNLVDKNL